MSCARHERPSEDTIPNGAILRTAEALIQYGALVVKDSRVSEEDNATFLDLLEDYFAQDNETLLKDTRPEFGYQGAQPRQKVSTAAEGFPALQSERPSRIPKSRDAHWTRIATS